MNTATARQWALEEFGQARLGDSRWRCRLVAMAERAARQPAGKVSEVFTNAAQRQGAYGLLELDRIGHEQISEAIFGACARRCSGESFVFVPVDGSSLSLTDKGKSKGFGAIGTTEFCTRGIKVLSALCVSPVGVTLGLSAQTWWTRQGEPKKQEYGNKPTEHKETQHWLTTMQRTRELMREHAPKTKCWFQLDREGDAWPILMQADADQHWFTIRGSYNRRVCVGDNITHLRSVIEQQAVRCVSQLPVSAAPKRAARIAKMQVRACTVTLDLCDKRNKKKHFSKQLNVVFAREHDTTPVGEKPIEWLLLTNRPVQDTKQITQVLYGYSLRWRIEDFHRSWKGGACNVEQMQLRSVGAAIKWATVLAAVAIRIERLKLLSRSQPQQPASEEFSPLELKAIVLLRFEDERHKQPPPGAVPTIAQATTWLAEIGGYTGKSSGGPPGSTVLARGLKQVQIAVRTLQALSAKKM